MDREAMMAKIEKMSKIFGEERHKAVTLFEDCVCYPLEDIIRLYRMQSEIEMSYFLSDTEPDEAVTRQKTEEFKKLREAMKKRPDAPERIYLWPEGVLPTETVYTENPNYRYNHDPDFVPYLYEVLVGEDVEPKGAVVVCAGGDHGSCVLPEGYGVCRELNERGYQCFLLLNRPNHNPWGGKECGADAARAIRYVRANAAKYRIPETKVSFAGFSNGGLTGECCIQYYSGMQTVQGHFPEYQPDELDDYKGAPDTFLCVYGPRFVNGPFDYEGVEYPPVFFAVGREDTAMNNLNYVYPDLIAHGIQVEVHTFAGVPHGKAGIALTDGCVNYPNFQLWTTLADAFMQDVYAKANNNNN